eukprot:NODE_11527_length_303_cov_10.299213_g10614_i0.p2 GENE.NODE_11527_length_303_cov_10.299213_g10614_i0~~NODE_11527_length_303_cov_10.299213_g10614_i0.p2  ORF type:complete len:56 (+),score=2.17 NODE_11527_length_303_cov_10.299213_g10614_i0:113-280(+)
MCVSGVVVGLQRDNSLRLAGVEGQGPFMSLALGIDSRPSRRQSGFWFNSKPFMPM